MVGDPQRRWLGALMHRALWVTVSFVLAYVVLAAALPTQPFLEFVRILQATAAIIVVVAFSGDAWDSVTRDKPDRSDALIVGVFLQHVSIFVTGIWLLLYRLGGREDWMLNLMWFGLLSGWLSIVASFLHVYPVGVLRSGDSGEEVPPARLRMVGIAAAVGVFAILVVLATQPNVRGLLETARPWMR